MTSIAISTQKGRQTASACDQIFVAALQHSQIRVVVAGGQGCPVMAYRLTRNTKRVLSAQIVVRLPCASSNDGPCGLCGKPIPQARPNPSNSATSGAYAGLCNNHLISA
jgi:hypothetical protein